MTKELLGEFLGTALLLFVIVGSGVAAAELGTDGAVQLLAHALIVGIGLSVIILLFQSVSGSHLNPAVTLALWRHGSISTDRALRYSAAQLSGAVTGVVVANLVFGLAPISIASTDRIGVGFVVSEVVGTFVIVLVIIALMRIGRPALIPIAVGAWVAVIIFATPSTGFANPAVTIARILTDTYTGISPMSVPVFLVAQLAAALLAVLAAGSLFPISDKQIANA